MPKSHQYYLREKLGKGLKCIRHGHFNIWHSLTLWDCKFDSYSCFMRFEIWISSKLFYLLL